MNIKILVKWAWNYNYCIRFGYVCLYYIRRRQRRRRWGRELVRRRRRRRRLIGVKRFLYETRRRKLAHADCFAPARQIPLDLRRRLRVSSQWSSVVRVLVPATILYVRVVVTISSGRILYDNDDDDDIILIYCIGVGAIESRRRWRVPPLFRHLRFHKRFTVYILPDSSSRRHNTIVVYKAIRLNVYRHYFEKVQTRRVTMAQGHPAKCWSSTPLI